MDADLHDLYQSIILDHNKLSRHYGVPETYTHSDEGFNPLCGDKVTVFLTLKDGHIETLCFESASCAICKASASMMTEALSGKSLQAAKELSDRIHKFLSADSDELVNPATDGELAALAGVRKFPARIKCALLPWETFENFEC